ncbi:hypothetical protein DLM86_00285 [Paenibacillus flagellatus]|uniref:Uncharacterized protein n=1 Tax=Paenibacillus flagellatus TaxID=2211139 RepID=A0A2V5KBJ7_9BACL|nr:hypothetical protein DLM86_00285 [Paenibacillus flagellatus]
MNNSHWTRIQPFAQNGQVEPAKTGTTGEWLGHGLRTVNNRLMGGRRKNRVVSEYDIRQHREQLFKVSGARRG